MGTVDTTQTELLQGQVGDRQSQDLLANWNKNPLLFLFHQANSTIPRKFLSEVILNLSNICFTSYNVFPPNLNCLVSSKSAYEIGRTIGVISSRKKTKAWRN